MKAAIYLRVSTEQQTVDPQRLELSNYAATRAIPIVAEFSDVISGRKFTRVGLEAMLAAAATGQFDAILIYKLDRLGRSIIDMLQLVQKLDRLGVAVIATSQGIDTSKSNPSGRLILHVLASVAEFERSLISERTIAGLATARANGKTLGKPSPKLAGVDRAAVVAEWREETGGVDFKLLATKLGGVNSSTAWRIAQKVA